MPTPNPRGAFTLVELLVVITIIVILMALLTPALDRAVYQAELATCSARLHATANGAAQYTQDSRGFYPNRVLTGSNWGWPQQVAEVALGHDLRPVLRGYIEHTAFLDPLSPKSDLSPERTGPNDLVFGNYNLWFGYGYLGQKLMRKRGDAWEVVPIGQTSPLSFRYIVGDIDSFGHDGTPRVSGSHPDADNTMSPFTSQAGDMGALSANTSSPNGRVTESRWTRNGKAERGLTDLNTAHEDGAVLRTASLRFDEWSVGGTTTRLPFRYLSPTVTVVYLQIPLP